MVKQRRRYSKEEIARRGRAMYQKLVRRKLAGEKKGRIVALDIETGDFEVADDILTGAETLLKRRPDSRVWLARIGYRTLRRFGTWYAEGSAR